MSRLIQPKRTIGLLVLLMAAVVALSGPVAEVLDPGSEPVAEAKKKHKKKKKKKKKNRRPAFNVVQCPTEQDGFRCSGTPANDHLIGGPEDRPEGALDFIFGGEGTDIYNGGNGGDLLQDVSTTSSDFYLFPATEFSVGGIGNNDQTVISDEGGGGDIVGLSSYSIEDFEVFGFGTFLILDGPEARNLRIIGFPQEENEIEYFLFREGYFTEDQVVSRIE